MGEVNTGEGSPAGLGSFLPFHPVQPAPRHACQLSCCSGDLGWRQSEKSDLFPLCSPSVLLTRAGLGVLVTLLTGS